MKKKLEGQKKRFLSVKLYKNDLDEIMRILSALDNFHRLEISDSENVYDSIADLEEHKGQKINDLTLSLASPLFSLRVSLQETMLIRGGEIETITPYVQIEDILKRRKRPFLAAILHPFPFSLFLLLISLSIHYVKPFFPENNLGTMVLIYSLVLLVVILSFLVHRFGGFSQVILINKHQEESFWKRNKDTLFITIITNILTAIFTFIVAYVLFKQGIKP